MSQTYFWKEARPTFSAFSCAKYRVTVARDSKIKWVKNKGGGGGERNGANISIGSQIYNKIPQGTVRTRL